MAVNLSPLGGVGAQFFDSNGNPLSGGMIYTYAAGTNTPQATYTSSSGLIQHSNPIVLDAAGRVPTGEIWLTDGVSYKFVIQTSAAVLVGTYDNIVGINSNFIAYTAQQEIQTATAGQTVFNLTTMQYQPSTNNLSVFVDGVNQYGPGAQYAYVETDSDTVTFVNGLHVGASVKFTTATPVSSGSTNAENVAYDPPFTGAVGTNVELKLAQTVSVKDFGAVGDGVTDDTQAVQDAFNSGATTINLPDGTYIVENLTISDSIVFQGTGTLKWKNASVDSLLTLEASSIVIDGITFDGNSTSVTQEAVPMIAFDTAPYVVFKNCTFQYIHYATVITDVDNSPYGRVENCTFKSVAKTIVSSGYNLAIKSSFWTIIGCVFQDFVQSHAVRVGLIVGDGTTPVRATKVIGCQFNDISSGGGVICELYAQDTIVVGNNFTDCEQSWKTEASGNTTKNNVFGLNTVRGTTNPTGANIAGTRNIAGLNIFEDCAGGINIGSECSVIGNLFYNCGDLANTGSVMQMSSPFSRSVISNNVITTSAYRGMNILANDVIISSNLIKGCADRSINLGSADRVKIIGNNIDGGTYGILSNSTTQDINMTNNYVANASTENYSISDETTALIDSTNYNYTGYSFLITVASGAITAPIRDKAIIRVASEGGAATDDLTTINVTGLGYIGQTIFIRIASNTEIVTVKDGTDIRLAGDWVPNSTDDWLMLMYTGTRWEEQSRSFN